MDEFLKLQKVRIEKRVAACEKAIFGKRIDAAFKAKKILPAQRLALVRIRTGQYGTCIGCGARIPRKRLQAVPAAIKCMSCQKRSEE